MNCQLYRSNILLGGQMKYDLILDSNHQKTIVRDLHITPISNSVPYNKYMVDNLFFYTHQENIVSYYKKISSSFYKDFVNPILNNLHPLPEDYNGVTYDSTYEMGCRRMSYQLYNKQFNFFCPVWLEKIDSMENLSFEIQIYSEGSSTPIFTRPIRFGEDQKITQYFTNYFKHIKLNEGHDWLFNIDENNSWVRGLNVKTGKLNEVGLLTLYENLTHRERPLLEFNNIIINELNKNYLIAPQLFNFNFCFNLEDIFNQFVYDSIKNHNIYINIVAKIDSKELDMYDIFSNYKYIGRKILQIPKITLTNDNISINEDAKSLNVLDYLHDYDCIDLIDKNKIVQNTCHWRLTNGEHFNLYQGFSPIYKNDKDGSFNTLPHYSENIADIDSVNINDYNYNKFQTWCNNYEIDDKDTVNHLVGGIFQGKYDYLFSKFTNNCIIKNIKYKLDPNIKEAFKEIDIAIFRIADNIYKDIVQSIINDIRYHGVFWKYYYKTFNNSTLNMFICYLQDTDITKVMIFSSTELPDDIYLYKKFTSNITDDVIFNDFKKLKPIKSDLKMVNFQNGLIWKPTIGPSLEVKEIDYYKTKQNKKMVRFFGKIKPYFIRKEDTYKNYQYYKYKLADIKEQYIKYIKTKFDPKYPSINYFSIGEQDYIDYGDNILNTNGYIETHKYSNYEFNNYIFNRIINLIPELNFEYEIISPANETPIVDIDGKINESLKDTYTELFRNLGIDGDENECMKYIAYIKKQYNLVNSNTDIVKLDDNEKKYKFNIQYKLI